MSSENQPECAFYKKKEPECAFSQILNFERKNGVCRVSSRRARVPIIRSRVCTLLRVRVRSTIISKHVLRIPISNSRIYIK